MRTEMLLVQTKPIHSVFMRSTADISQEESLRQPQLAGSSMNWVMGHLCLVRTKMLQLLAASRAPSPDQFAVYGNGTEPDEAQAMDIADLRTAFDAMQPLLVEALEGISSEALDQPAPFSPFKNPDETIGSLCAALLFHEAYHVGQVGILRRTLGHEAKFR